MPPVKKEEILKFQNEIEELVWMLDISYIDAVVKFCEDNDMEMESISRILSDKIKAEIQREAEELSLLKDKAMLRLF